MKIHILTPQLPYARGFNDFYPLIKWRRAFQRRKIAFRFFASHRAKDMLRCEILIVDYRYFQRLVNRKIYPDNGFVIALMQTAKTQGCKVVLFDSDDSTGSRCFSLTPYVDVHLKKQLLQDRSLYTSQYGKKSTMCWIPDGLLPEQLVYQPCRAGDFSKLKLAWNIGLVDYRRFRYASLYPVGTSALLNAVYKQPRTFQPAVERPLFTSYRGTASKDSRYGYQRNPLQVTLNKLANRLPIETGGLLAKRKFLTEMRNSKVIVSPYGWGEICYRDFECFINGNLLVKPDMSHVATFPNLFIPDETYVPVQWDLGDVEEKLLTISQYYKDYLPIARTAQACFMDAVTDQQSFFRHFDNVVLG